MKIKIFIAMIWLWSNSRLKAHKALQAIKSKSQKILSSPSTQDPVYKILQRLFKHESKYNLCSYEAESEEWEHVFSTAKKHFEHGFPPRKKDDTSYGDAINWQWCLHCVKNANSSTHDLVIVSNDSDYGIIQDGKSYVNDWLKKEFSDCISTKRKILLTNSLAEGLRLIDVTVSREARMAEQRHLKYLERLECNRQRMHECWCGASLMFDAQCSKCGEYTVADGDGEIYRIEKNRVYEYDQFGEESIITCSRCNSERMYIEYADTCASCAYNLDTIKDD